MLHSHRLIGFAELAVTGQTYFASSPLSKGKHLANYISERNSCGHGSFHAAFHGGPAGRAFAWGHHEGELGDAMPGITRLASTLDVSANRVTAALERLVREDLQLGYVAGIQLQLKAKGHNVNVAEKSLIEVIRACLAAQVKHR